MDYGIFELLVFDVYLFRTQLICSSVAICLAVRAKKAKNKVHPSQDDIKAGVRHK